MPTVTPRDAISLLKADHRKVEELFAKFKAAKGSDKKQRLVAEICTELTIHTMIEEEIFYPACRGKVEEDMVEEAYVEHDGAKALIGQLESENPGEEYYDAKVTVLSEQIQHHVAEEEKRSEGLFAQARAAGLDMDDLGARMAQRKQELMAKFKVGGTPAPEMRTTGPASPRASADQSTAKM